MKKLLIVTSILALGACSLVDTTATGDDSCTLYTLVDTTETRCLYESMESAGMIESKRVIGMRCRLSRCKEEADTATIFFRDDSATVGAK